MTQVSITFSGSDSSMVCEDIIEAWVIIAEKEEVLLNDVTFHLGDNTFTINNKVVATISYEE